MKIKQHTDEWATSDVRPSIRQAVSFALAAVALCLMSSGCGSGKKGPPAQPPADAGPAAQEPAPGLPMVREEAKAGVGAKGHDYEPGMITTPVEAYFTAKEKVALEVKIPYAMQLHKGLYGSAPATQEEFMEKIIKENQIHLPELPEGQRYVYDPETEKLMVEHPKGAAPAGAAAK